MPHESAPAVLPREARTVEEEDARIGDERDADVGALGLAAADALGERVANLDVAAGRERQRIQQLLNSSPLVVQRLAHGPLQLRRVQQHLLHRQHRQQRVELLHIAGVAAQEGAAGLGAAKQQRAGRLARRLAPRQHVQKRRLAAAAGAHLRGRDDTRAGQHAQTGCDVQSRGTHQRRHLARLKDAADVAQQERNLLGVLVAGHRVAQVLLERVRRVRASRGARATRRSQSTVRLAGACAKSAQPAARRSRAHASARARAASHASGLTGGACHARETRRVWVAVTSRRQSATEAARAAATHLERDAHALRLKLGGGSRLGHAARVPVNGQAARRGQHLDGNGGFGRHCGWSARAALRCSARASAAARCRLAAWVRERSGKAVGRCTGKKQAVPAPAKCPGWRPERRPTPRTMQHISRMHTCVSVAARAQLQSFCSRPQKGVEAQLSSEHRHGLKKASKRSAANGSSSSAARATSASPWICATSASSVVKSASGRM